MADPPTFEFVIRADGLLHLWVSGHDLLRGPLGVLLYCPFIALWWLIPRHWRVGYLSISSLLLALVSLGPGYTATIAALVLLGYGLARSAYDRQRSFAGIAILSAIYTAMILFPQPPWLPPVSQPLYFYLHWAGIGYIYLKSLHVLVEAARRTLPRPRFGDFCAYLLFAPTLRMGPIYRYNNFLVHLHVEQAANVQVGYALLRIATALLRLGVMTALTARFPIDQLFAEPESLAAWELIAGIYAAPLSIYLWISGYLDLSVGLGRLMGFVVPENFCYPWAAANIADFWRRWHITLGAWLRDYLYIPLGGNRRHVFFNYLAAFLFAGLWHGTYLSYVLWGFSQGFGLAVRREWARYWAKRREYNTPTYNLLRKMRLADSRLAWLLGWLLTFHYQIATIAWFMDERFAGRRMAERIWTLIFE